MSIRLHLPLGTHHVNYDLSIYLGLEHQPVQFLDPNHFWFLQDTRSHCVPYENSSYSDPHTDTVLIQTQNFSMCVAIVQSKTKFDVFNLGRKQFLKENNFSEGKRESYLRFEEWYRSSEMDYIRDMKT